MSSGSPSGTPDGADGLIARLGQRVRGDAELSRRLQASLEIARRRGGRELDPALFAALEWPLDLDEYLDYLNGFARWVPRQSDADAWRDPETGDRQEVYDRLCHFYWLIDQPPEGEDGVAVESIPWFAEWLVDYARAWGSFLDSPASFSDEVLASFVEGSPRFEVRDSMIGDRPNAPSGWLTFNQFFARELNPGLRPIAEPADNRVLVAPADCTFKARYPIGADSRIPEITVKETHRFASVESLLAGSEHADAFAGGRFAHYFLGPYSYHRFHAPVAGAIVESRAVAGRHHLDVGLSGGQFEAADSAEGGYEFSQARGVLVLDTSGSEAGDVGLIAVLPVGMAQVSSVRMTAAPGGELLKGEEFGYFLFGGSDIIVLSQAGAEAEFDAGDGYRRYGTAIARCRNRSRD